MAEGSTLHHASQTETIAPVSVGAPVDPTGCGDAYRAGLLYGLGEGLDWETTARLAAVMGALKIEQAGAQNHTADRSQIGDRFAEAFGYRPW
jgi:adenosine kinase